MDELLARYFDGELTEEDAGELLKAAESDPALEAELRRYERTLSLAKTAPFPKPPHDFTERVMRSISPARKRSFVFMRPSVFGAGWAGAARIAAGLAVVFFFGL